MKICNWILKATLGLLFVCMGVNVEAQNNKRKISNELYSVIIPSDWCPMSGNGKKRERKMRNYNLHYLVWRTPEGVPVISMGIKSYQKIDKSLVSIKEVEALEIDTVAKYFKVERLQEMKLKLNRKRITLIKTAEEGDGEMTSYRVFYLLTQSRQMVHTMRVSIREADYKKIKPQKMIDDILNSFSVK